MIIRSGRGRLPNLCLKLGIRSDGFRMELMIWRIFRDPVMSILLGAMLLNLKNWKGILVRGKEGILLWALPVVTREVLHLFCKLKNRKELMLNKPIFLTKVMRPLRLLWEQLKICRE